MSICWECDQERGAELSSCRVCGAPALRPTTQHFRCDTCRRPGRTGARLVGHGKTTCMDCYFGEDPPPPKPEKLRWPTALWRWL